ncbi:helix-turn-helix domain-containing protein [Azohydromonas lata]|uniref:Helix-turn-helix domain-containing protein n=1 Tax=Azohydromonas lata TaxID=45677 RepID=A0ABU5ILW2_9BURK|nr:helix-turn-helix domain-containing protein [Azohydromonas lata]MDZ5459839.1 helix-turn-helix domain-containing protein [Azohydromonas lata]
MPHPLPLSRQEPPPRVACSGCHLRSLCLPQGLHATAAAWLDGMVSAQLAVPRGQALLRAGAPLESLYAVRTGFFKTRVTAQDGREQVAGFQMAGDLLGLAGIASGRHTVDAVALEDSQVCVIPFGRQLGVGADVQALQQQLLRIMSRLIVHDHGVMLLLGSLGVRERLAAFLIRLTQRLQALGYSASALVLRMTREDMGSYLGMKEETVSRAFTWLQAQGLLEVRQREIRILDPQGLQQVAAAGSR